MSGVIGVNYLLHVVDVDESPPAKHLECLEDAAGQRLLAFDVLVDVPDLDAVRVLAVQRHP